MIKSRSKTSIAKKKPRQGGLLKLVEILDYDTLETTHFIDPSKPLTLNELGFMLPKTPPTQVISIRLPSQLLNELKAYGSQRDVPYQALIKLFLSEKLAELRG